MIVKVSYRRKGSESSVGIGCRCGCRVYGCCAGRYLRRSEADESCKGRCAGAGGAVLRSAISMLMLVVGFGCLCGGIVQRRCRLGLISLVIPESVGLTPLTAMLLTYLCISVKMNTSVDHAVCNIHARYIASSDQLQHWTNFVYMSMLSPPLAKLKFCCCC